jgi:hypothetical protein
MRAVVSVLARLSRRVGGVPRARGVSFPGRRGGLWLVKLVRGGLAGGSGR